MAAMRNRKNLINFLMKGLLAFVFLLVVVMVFTPSLINLEMVKNTIKENISSNVGGRITYRNLKLSYFPRPHVVIYGTEISVPEGYTIASQWMRIYPKILPLLKGRLRFAYIKVDYADFFMKLPQIQDAALEQPEIVPSYDEMVKTLTAAVRGLSQFELPDLNLSVKNGKVNLIDPYGRKFMLRELQASYERGRNGIDFSIKCKSNLWEQIEISGLLDPSTFKGRGRVQLAHFRPQTLIAYLFPDTALRIEETRASVNIDFKSEGAGSIKADVDGIIPFLELNRGSAKLVIKGVQIKGALEVAGKTARAELTELGLEYPTLNMNGTFSYDESLQDIQLAINGSRIDADSLRQSALAMVGDSETIRTVFDVIRGGQVPWITVRIRGRTIQDFGLLDNIVIEGQMTQGKVFIPEAELDLEEVFGDAVISDGVLKGRNLRARFGKSYGQDGSLDLGLSSNPEPFHLDIGVNADLSQLPPVLNRIVAEKNFLRELARVKDFQGAAQGRLSLGDDLENLRARVEVTEVHVNTRYSRIPYPIRINGGHFLFDANRIALKNFNAEIGESVLSQLSTTIDWAQNPTLKILSKTAKFDLSELYAWLLSFENFKTSLADVRSLSGIVTAEDLNVKGPLFTPRNWHFQTRGSVDSLTVSSRRLPQTLQIARGLFTWQATQLDFSQVEAAMGKSSIIQVSGNVSWGKKAIFSATAGGSLFNLEDLAPLIFSSKKISNLLQGFKPLKGTLAFNRLTYSGPVTATTLKQVSLSADVKQLTIHSRRFPGALRVNRGQFTWQSRQLGLKNIEAAFGKSKISRLSASFNPVRKASFELQCGTAQFAAGEIHSFLSSFEEIQPALQDFSTSEGALTFTDFTLSGPLNEPTDWQYDSTGNMQNIIVRSDALADPVTVNSGTFHLSTETSAGINRRRIAVETMNLAWKDKPLAVAGDLSSAGNEILLNFSIDADALEWPQIKTFLDYVGKRKPLSDKGDRASHLKGTIRFLAQNFKYESYIVNPLQAEITFQEDKVVIAIGKADVCGISFRGLVNLSGQILDLYFVPTPIDNNLDSTLGCITAKKNLATGTFSLNGEIMANTKPEALTRSLMGKLAFSAEKGRIYRFGLLAKLLAILNVTEIYRGHVPDLAGEGFAYHSMSASAKLQGGKITMEDCTIDGASMGIACKGDIDLVRKEMDLTILVAPFKTVDRIVDILPLIGRVLGGKLISIPFQAIGPLNDPEVYPLPPTAVGSGMLGILERTLKLPISIIQPLISGIKKGMSNQPDADDKSPH
jgi:hypothetical protein